MRRVILVVMLPLLLLFGSTQSVRADSLADAFNYLVSTTAPGSYNSQIRGFLSAGSINVSFPTGTVTLISITPPSFQQGCGGISMFLGGLAYISGAQFTQMLKQIASASLGYTFQLALRTLCPLCSTILADLQKAAQMASQMAINQCQFAKGLVNKVADASGLNSYIQGEASSADAQGGTGGSSFLSDFDKFGSDIQAGWDSITKFVDSMQTDAEKQQAKAEQPVGNSTWQAMPDADATQKIFVMSLIGTTFRAPPSDGHKTYVQPTMPTLSTKQLANLFVFGAKGRANQNIIITGCEDTALYKDSGFNTKYCVPNKVPITSSLWYSQQKDQLIGGVNLADYGFYGAVYALLIQAIDNNRNENKLGTEVDVTLPSSIYGEGVTVKASFTTEQIEAFLSTAPIPLYQAINLATWDANVSISLTSSISELVASQYTLAYIEHVILDTSKVGNSKAGSIGGHARWFERIEGALKSIHSNEIQI